MTAATLNGLPAPRLPLGRYRLHWRAGERVQLPAFTGSMWRGTLGHALRRLACVTHQPRCAGCPLLASCVYAYVFETPPGREAGRLRKYEQAPHPYAFAVPLDADGQTLDAGATTTLDLHLYGHGNRYAGYVLHALAQGAERGVGQGRGRLQLEGIEQHDGHDWRSIRAADGTLAPLAAVEPPIPAVPEQVRLTLLTPLRLKRDEHCVTPEGFTFAALFMSLLRRLSLIDAFHTDTPLATDFRALRDAATGVVLHEPAFAWQELQRYSARQQQTLQIGGLLGSCRLDGAGLAPFWAYLWLGQYAHAGKNASMGLGRYRLEAAS